ncbi:hypothetical protein [Paraburkholderia aspalathi]|nr:hypothetical protein [Paraburkholderia aspalathi]
MNEITTFAEATMSSRVIFASPQSEEKHAAVHGYAFLSEAL